MPVRRRKKVVVNTKQILDVMAAALIVQKAPDLINSFFPNLGLDPMMTKIAGAGAGYLTGVMLDRSDIANASLALAVVDLVSPMIDQVIGGVTGVPVENAGITMQPPLPPSNKYGALTQTDNYKGTGDFLSLNDYVDDPGVRMSVASYRDSY